MEFSTRSKRPPPECDDDAQRMKPHPARWLLRGADRDAFVEAALNPPEPTDELIAALRRHRELFG
jgi:hypothetical protein